MKALRRMKILELIKDHVIETQQDLAHRLRQEGIEVTQATVSRDIKDLHLVKVPSGDGRYRYAVPDDQVAGWQTETMRRIFRDCLVNMDSSENLIVVKALPATGPAVGEAIDNLGWPEVVGTVAGDNTVLVVVRSREATSVVLDRFRRLVS